MGIIHMLIQSKQDVSIQNRHIYSENNSKACKHDETSALTHAFPQRCSHRKVLQNTLQIYRRTAVLKCKTANLLFIFRTPFLKTPLGVNFRSEFTVTIFYQYPAQRESKQMICLMYENSSKSLIFLARLQVLNLHYLLQSSLFHRYFSCLSQ